LGKARESIGVLAKAIVYLWTNGDYYDEFLKKLAVKYLKGAGKKL
jgi:hypothetical protein